MTVMTLVAVFQWFTLLLVLKVFSSCLCFADKLPAQTEEKVIEAISYFVRSKQFSKATDGSGGGFQLDLTWNRVGLLSELAKNIASAQSE